MARSSIPFSLFGIQAAALGEILELLNKSGIEMKNSLAILNELPIMTPAAKRIGGLIEQQNFSPNFPIDSAAKNFCYVVETAENIGVFLPISKTVYELFNWAKEQSGDLDIARIYRQFAK